MLIWTANPYKSLWRNIARTLILIAHTFYPLSQEFTCLGFFFSSYLVFSKFLNFDLQFMITIGQNCCLNKKFLDAFLSHEPQPSTMKNMIHLSQSEFFYRVNVGNWVLQQFFLFFFDRGTKATWMIINNRTIHAQIEIDLWVNVRNLVKLSSL